MKLLFMHPNMPGQYKHLCPAFAQGGENEVVFLTKGGKTQMEGVQTRLYKLRRDASAFTHRYLIHAERAILQGQEVWRCLRHLKESEGFVPDVIIAHPGWGDALYVKDIYPDTPLLSFFEFYYHANGVDVGFDPADPVRPDDMARVRSKNMHHLQGLVDADWGISPTLWQRSLHPPEFLPKITPLHDGVNIQICTPNAQARFTLKDGRSFKLGDEVVTYIARNFEPYRGFPTFIQAAQRILQQRPNCHIIAVGADDISYGRKLAGDATYRQQWLAKLPMDLERLHFVGQIPYDALVQMMQVSAAHIYLTYPFVLSWSSMEAMACGCAVVASNTPPVREIIRHGENGFLVDFFDHEALADQVIEVLNSPDSCAQQRMQARADMVQRYDLQTLLPLHMQLVREVAEKRFAPPAHAAALAMHTPEALARSPKQWFEAQGQGNG